MKHPSLPQAFTPELLASWIVQNSKEKYTEERKTYYTEDELLAFKDKAVSAGIEINNLASTKANINKVLEDGCEEFFQVDIMATRGLKLLKLDREKAEKEVEKGYMVEEVKIYGIPNQETRNMDFFDIEGNEIPDRMRALSAKEIREYVSQYTIQIDKQA